MIKKIGWGLLFSLIFAIQLNGQALPKVEMADALRQEGKFYVVILIMAVIFLGLGFYLWRLDRRLSQLEKTEK